jgi:hypothetical protein
MSESWRSKRSSGPLDAKAVLLLALRLSAATLRRGPGSFCSCVFSGPAGQRIDRMLVRSEDTRYHLGVRPLAMVRICLAILQCAFQNSPIHDRIGCVFYIIIDMYISIYERNRELHLSEQMSSIGSFFVARDKRANQTLNWVWEEASSLSSARLRLSSATLLSRVRPSPATPLGRTPNGRRPSRAQAISPVFLHCVPCRPSLRYVPFRFASRDGRSPSACTCYPCPRRRVAQGLLVNNNRQYQKAERTTR